MTGTVSLSFTQRSGLRSCDITRTDTITLDVIFAIFGSDIASQHLQTTFGGSISRYGLTAEFAHHRADIDDLSVSFLDHGRNNCFRDDKRTVQVDIDHLAEFGSRHFHHRDTFDDTGVVHHLHQQIVPGNPGVVHQNIDYAYLLFDLCNESIHLLFIRHVANITVSFDTFSFIGSETLIHQFLFDIVKHDSSTGFSERRRNRKPDTVRSTCYKCNLTFQ